MKKSGRFISIFVLIFVFFMCFYVLKHYIPSSDVSLNTFLVKLKVIEKKTSTWPGFKPYLLNKDIRDTSYSASMNRKRILFQHIPKSGGTSLCDLYKNQKSKTAKVFNKAIKETHDMTRHNREVNNGIDMNCWTYIDPPLHYMSSKVRNLNCKQREEALSRTFPKLKFSMQERFMDTTYNRSETLFCPNLRYGIFIREPLERAVSHIHFFAPKKRDYGWWPTNINITSEDVLKDILYIKEGLLTNNKSMILDIKEKTKMSFWQTRNLFYLTNNYLFRFLLGTQLLVTKDETSLDKKIPEIILDNRNLDDFIERAKHALTQFDFIILSSNIQTNCSKNILKKYLEVDKTSMPNSRHHKPTSSVEMRRKELAKYLEPWNKIDIELYQFAKKLSEQQCNYFEND